MTALYTLDRMTVGSTDYMGLINWTWSPAFRASLNAGGSEVDATIRAVVAGEPLLTFDTIDVKATLQNLHNTGGTPHLIPHQTIAAGSVATIYLQSCDENGFTRGTAGSNRIMTVNKGLIVPQSLGTAGDLVVLRCAVYADYDGTNLPFELNDSQNLEAGTGAAAAVLRVNAIKNGSAGSVLFRLDNVQVNFGIQVVRPPTRDVWPRDAVIVRYAPTATFTSADLAGALTAAGFGSAAAASGGLRIILADYLSDGIGVEATGNLALAFRETTSRMYPTTLNFGEGGAATIDYMVAGGGNNALATYADSPLYLVTNVSAEAESATAKTYKAGPIYDGAAAYDIRSGTVDFGIAMQARGPANALWPTSVIGLARAPTANVILDDLDDQAAYGNLANAAAAGFALFARACTVDGVPYASAQAQHVRILFPVADVQPAAINVAHNALAQPGLIVHGIKGAGNMLTVSTGVAITAPT
jgi:hypothetical protein